MTTQTAELKRLMALALETGASDLHLKALAPPAMRVHGVLAPIPDAPVFQQEDIDRMLEEITTPEQRARLTAEKELDFSAILEEAGVRFRVNASYQRDSLALVMRVVPGRVPSFEELGPPDAFRVLAGRRQGLVLVTGAAGTGKSTSLAAMIDHINGVRQCHVVTIEDPIEFVHQDRKAYIAQREVGLDTTSFAEALRRVLRQDPDVILIGEMRDLETIATALTAAETGHLVLATLHTNNAPQTIDRIIDVFPPGQQTQVRLQLSAVLQGIMSMALLPKADGPGRVPAVEVLMATPAVRNLIRDGKTYQIPNIMQMGTRDGSQTMEQALRSLVERQLVRREDTLFYAPDHVPDASRAGAR